MDCAPPPPPSAQQVSTIPVALVPPRPQGRHRASSTSCRPQLSLASLGRRQQPTSQDLTTSEAPVQSIASEASLSQDHRPSMIVLIASKLLDWFHVQTKHSRAWSSSTQSSPCSSTDEFLLPVSAAAHQATFGDVFNEKRSYPFARWQFVPALHAPILLVLLLFPLSTALVFFTVYTLPMSLSSWPHTLTDLAQLGRELHGYSHSGLGPMAHVIGVMAITAIWKHAWSIPGSVIWNVMAGALFSPALATLLSTCLTTIGSLCASLLAMPLAPYLAHLFPRALDLTRAAINGPNTDSGLRKSTSSAWVRLSMLRLIGVVPWSGINIACGVCGVPVPDIMLGAFIGTMPWTAVTCQIGDILQSVASSPPSPTQQTVSSLLTSPTILIKLVFLSFLSLAPLLAREHLRAAFIAPSNSPAPSPTADIEGEEERQHRWAWVKEWRSRIRLSSKSRTRTRERVALGVLVREKEEMYEAQDVQRLES